MIDIYRHKTLLRKNLSAQALKSIQLQMPTNSYLDVKTNCRTVHSDQDLMYKKYDRIRSVPILIELQNAQSRRWKKYQRNESDGKQIRLDEEPET